MKLIRSVFNLARSAATAYGFKIERRYDIERYRLDLLDVCVASAKPEDGRFCFVQVGANDGSAYDPIHHLIRKYGWSGVLIEPQGGVFQKLLANYAWADQLFFENAALAREDSRAPFWEVTKDRGRSSFDKTALYKDGFPDNDIIEVAVQTISPATLISKYHIERLDLLVVDTEGFDFEVLKMFFQTHLRPKIIQFEHVHLSARDRKACVEMLGRSGYKLARTGHFDADTIAVRNLV